MKRGHRLIGQCVICRRGLFCCERVTYGFGDAGGFEAHEGCAMPVRVMHPEIVHVDVDELLRAGAPE